MHVLKCRWVIAVLAGLNAIPVWATPPERTFALDAVELLAGREAIGKADLMIVRDGIEYRFASAENKATFEKDPAKYEAVDGGACGRMGPLASLGDARRFAVHDGRIYFFASDGCRAGFLKEPSAFIEVEEEMPFGSNDQVLKGREVLDKVATWAGGVEKLREIESFRAHAARTENQGGKEWKVANEAVIVFPNSYYQREAWNDSWFSTLSCPDGGAMDSARSGKERIAPSRARAFNRVMAHQPLVLIKAHVDGAPQADCPGLVVIADGEGELDGVPVEFVRVWLNGSTSRLSVEKATGRLMALSFHGRDGTMKVGDSVHRFTSYATVEGITLPVAYTATFNGKELPSSAGRVDGFEINGKIPADLFRVDGAERRDGTD